MSGGDDTCLGCLSPMADKRLAYSFLIARGFSIEDAAAKILKDNTSNAPVQKCCISHLENYIDPDESTDRYDEIKERIKQESINRGVGVDANNRVFIYVSNESRTHPGAFHVMDQLINDVRYLGSGKSEDGQSERGFIITDIAPLSMENAKQLGWSTNPLVLTSGGIQIVPVVKRGATSIPGTMWVRINNEGIGDYPLKAFDRSFLNSEIEHVIEQPMVYDNELGQKTNYSIVGLVVGKANAMDIAP